ncbi:putative methyltransferase-domain-containing protein [Protomyces lactucae-debilis]|uniref:Putative methyltransferase-domain-containing protein n=1 Tax=Protomyces lactucae-debilis TaxID=2754530 RepID=A0A1Y2FGK6_PROLT|nr:putative methyltransferase-domain-containing protein [Protomyces lactucae-debilis]ORY83053.1 putative methyltransferase-domain-containing protein [Protomyces lactucae-debilis]
MGAYGDDGLLETNSDDDFASTLLHSYNLEPGPTHDASSSQNADVMKASSITDTGVQQAKIVDRDASAATEIITETYYTLACHGASILLERDPFAGTGGLLWPAGERLAMHLCRVATQDPSRFANKRIIELGTGTGVVGIAMAMTTDLGKEGLLVLTDLDPVLPIVKRNIALNGCSPSRVTVERLAWGEALPSLFKASEGHPVDVVVMADVIYHEDLFQPLLDTLLYLFQANPGMVGYLGYKKRRRADWLFQKSLRRTFEMRLLEEVQPVCIEQVHSKDERWRQGVYLYELTLRSPS